jgi:hypothetical protein
LNLEANEILDPELVPLEAIEGPPVRDARVAGASLGAFLAGKLVFTIGLASLVVTGKGANFGGIDGVDGGPVLNEFVLAVGTGCWSLIKDGTYFFDILEIVYGAS